MTYALVIAGLPIAGFDRIKKESEKKFVPNGRLITAPNHAAGSYAKNHAISLIKGVRDFLLTQNEQERTNILLLYVNYGEHTTIKLLDDFFPFSLPCGISPLKETASLSRKNAGEFLNEFVDTVIAASKVLRERSNVISEFTNVANLTPLLLPLKNYRNKHLLELLRFLYREIVKSDDPKALIKSAVQRFLAQNPRAYAPGDDRHCLCDDFHYFRSPGKHRHGYFRQSSALTHPPECLLNARSRVGGCYDYRFHYDCEPKKGSVHSAYPNCHGEDSPSKSTHINIAPNDFIG